jgi:N-formylglutamate amidohydrolase
MDGTQPLSSPAASGPAPFALSRAADGAKPTPVIFASPHSGRFYPPEMIAASSLDGWTIRRSEDAHVDELIAGAPSHGHSLIAAHFARAWLDVNREPWELDQGMFEDELPVFARVRTARVAAGLGAIARIVCEGQEIYSRKLTFADAEARVQAVHQPYHAALCALIAETRAAFGCAVLIDWHSMPAAAASAVGADCDFVLGDRFGAACSGGLTRFVEDRLRAMDYAVARNAPYAGGYTTEHYGRPGRGVHALQIEISRALYLDEAKLAPAAGFPRLRADLERLFRDLASVDWARL